MLIPTKGEPLAPMIVSQSGSGCFTTVTRSKQGFDLANTLEGVLGAFAFPSLNCGVQIPPQPLLAVERDGMAPSGLDGGRVCLWVGEQVAIMRDRTLDEGNDLGQA
jgi:hypothetical protein